MVVVALFFADCFYLPRFFLAFVGFSPVLKEFLRENVKIFKKIKIFRLLAYRLLLFYVLVKELQIWFGELTLLRGGSGKPLLKARLWIFLAGKETD